VAARDAGEDDDLALLRGELTERAGRGLCLYAAGARLLDRSYNIDVLGGTRVSDQAWQNSFYAAIGASAAAVLGCAAAWLEDFRADLARITVPVLVVHGGQDRIMPPGAAGNRLPGLLGSARHMVIPDGPHAVIWTHGDEVNKALLSFIDALLLVTADLFHLIRGQPGDDRGPRGRVQGIKLVLDVLDGGLGLLVFLAQQVSSGGQRDGGGRQQRRSDDPRR
jgi:hypothetical protein